MPQTDYVAYSSVGRCFKIQPNISTTEQVRPGRIALPSIPSLVLFPENTIFCYERTLLVPVGPEGMKKGRPIPPQKRAPLSELVHTHTAHGTHHRTRKATVSSSNPGLEDMHKTVRGK